MSHADQGNDDAARTAEAVLRRGHKHIRRLVVITIGLWIVAALLIPAVYLPLGAKLKQYSEIIKEPAPPAAPLTAQQMGDALTEIQHQQWIVGQLVLHEWIIGAIILGLGGEVLDVISVLYGRKRQGLYEKIARTLIVPASIVKE